MKLIVGLGNPGQKYRHTRHNCGFMVIDELARRLGVAVDRDRFEAKIAETFVDGEKVILMKPETFMNNSGVAIRKAMDYYKIAPEDVLIIYDDLDTPVGELRLRQKGSAGGHNGIKSVIAYLLTNEFNRIRVGIGRDKNIPIIDYVLTTFKPEEREPLLKAVQKASDAAYEAIAHPFNKVMSDYNPRSAAKKKPSAKSQIRTALDQKGIDTHVLEDEIETVVVAENS